MPILDPIPTPQIRFAGAWSEAARRVVARAIADAEALYARRPTEAPWVCFCAQRGNTTVYAAHAPGRDRVLHAAGPGALGTKILLSGLRAAEVGHPAPSDPSR